MKRFNNKAWYYGLVYGNSIDGKNNRWNFISNNFISGKFEHVLPYDKN